MTQVFAPDEVVMLEGMYRTYLFFTIFAELQS